VPAVKIASKPVHIIRIKTKRLNLVQKKGIGEIKVHGVTLTVSAYRLHKDGKISDRMMMLIMMMMIIIMYDKDHNYLLLDSHLERQSHMYSPVKMIVIMDVRNFLQLLRTRCSLSLLYYHTPISVGGEFHWRKRFRPHKPTRTTCRALSR
jgi:hypothetical protein